MANSNLKVSTLREQAQLERDERCLRESDMYHRAARKFSPKQHFMRF